MYRQYICTAAIIVHIIGICTGTTVCMVITYNKGKDQPCKVTNPACAQLHREDEFFPVPVRV